MANNRFNKQVTPKGYKMGGRVKKMGGGMMKRPMYKDGSLKPVDKEKNPGLSKLPTKVRNKMGFMKKGGVVSGTKKKQFKANKAGQKSFNKKAMKVAKTIGKIVIPGAAAADAGVKLAKKFKGTK